MAKNKAVQMGPIAKASDSIKPPQPMGKRIIMQPAEWDKLVTLAEVEGVDCALMRRVLELPVREQDALEVPSSFGRGAPPPPIYGMGTSLYAPGTAFMADVEWECPVRGKRHNEATKIEVSVEPFVNLQGVSSTNRAAIRAQAAAKLVADVQRAITDGHGSMKGYKSLHSLGDISMTDELQLVSSPIKLTSHTLDGEQFEVWISLILREADKWSTMPTWNDNEEEEPIMGLTEEQSMAVFALADEALQSKLGDLTLEELEEALEPMGELADVAGMDGYRDEMRAAWAGETADQVKDDKL
jgi:hypothetical protein